MQNVSADLVWQCTRKYNSFLVKRDQVVLTAEPGNPTNKHSAKFSGLANKKTVDVKASKDAVVITLRKTKDQNKPAKAVQTIKVKAADPNRTIRTARKLVGASFYRPAAENVVATRVSKLAQAAVAANKMNKGKLSVKYGRNAKPFAFNQTTSKKSTAAAEELPPLTAVDEMD